MVIYADILFLTNLYIDFLLLLCVKRFLHLRARIFRLVIGAVLGAACSLLALLPALPAPLLALIGLLCALLISLSAFAPMKRAMVLKAALAYWVFSLIFAGFFLFIYNIFAPDILAIRNGTVYLDLSPLMLFGFTLLAYAAAALFRRVFQSGGQDRHFLKITVRHGGGEAALYAKTDTGNSLKEPFSGLPVIVAEAEALRAIAPEAVLSFLKTGDGTGQIRLVPFEGMGGSGILPAFRPDAVHCGKNTAAVPCYIALCGRKLSAGQFNALCPPDLLPAATGKTQPARANT